MQPQDIFDVCLERVREYQALSARVTAIRTDACAKDGAPRTGNHLAEYIADFALAGRSALKPWPRRAAVFELYFVANVPYRATIAKLKLRPGTMDWWCSEIKKAVGKELARRGLFPPRRYRERSKVND